MGLGLGLLKERRHSAGVAGWEVWIGFGFRYSYELVYTRGGADIYCESFWSKGTSTGT